MSVLYQTTQESGAHKKLVESSIILSLRPIVHARWSAVRVARGGRGGGGGGGGGCYCQGSHSHNIIIAV